MRLPRIAALTAAALLVLAACGDGDDPATVVPDADEAPVATAAADEVVVDESPAMDEGVVEDEVVEE